MEVRRPRNEDHRDDFDVPPGKIPPRRRITVVHREGDAERSDESKESTNALARGFNEREPAPLSLFCGYYDVDPPTGLAGRTCRKIWDHVDAQREVEGEVVSVLSLNRGSSPATTVLPVEQPLGPLRTQSEDASAITEKRPQPVTLQPVAPPAVAVRTLPVQPPSRAVTRSRYFLEYAVAMTLGLVLALAAYPVLVYAKDRLIAVVFQTKIREMTQSANSLDRIQSAVTNAGMQTTYRGFDPQKAVWSGLDFRSVNTVPVAFPSFPRNETETDWPLRVSPSCRDSFLASHVLSGKTAIADGGAIPDHWIEMLSGESSHLVGCCAAPEQIRGQNVVFYSDSAFFRTYPQDRSR